MTWAFIPVAFVSTYRSIAVPSGIFPKSVFSTLARALASPLASDWLAAPTASKVQTIEMTTLGNRAQRSMDELLVATSNVYDRARIGYTNPKRQRGLANASG